MEINLVRANEGVLKEIAEKILLANVVIVYIIDIWKYVNMKLQSLGK
jgi:hypothetical protein